MSGSFRVHSVFAAVLAVALLLFVAVTWLPGPSPVDGTGWAALTVIGAVVLVPAALVVRLRLNDVEAELWPAFRELRRPLRRALVALLLTAAAALVLSVVHGDLLYQEPEALAGRYYASKVSGDRGRIEVTKAGYEAVVENEQRVLLSLAGCVAAFGACATFTAREMFRVDRRS
ncbi:hypothetical protein AB0F46_31145 [Streptomyces sp. NPDC026665]|uniref:hypothetical protein n=1 Tax=Streptomyces sp. NPDC026665 TaxID=3154798 RepID=UPI0033F64168